MSATGCLKKMGDTLMTDTQTAFVLVPREPDKGMLTAALRSVSGVKITDPFGYDADPETVLRLAIRSALSAAPKPPESEIGPGRKIQSQVPEDMDEVEQLKVGVLDLYDTKGIPIRRGDLVKVFHFIGARKKRHYMYKQCLGYYGIGPEGKSPYLRFGHLNFAEDGGRNHSYLMRPDGSVLDDYEIVQSIKCDHDRRERIDLHSAALASKKETVDERPA